MNRCLPDRFDLRFSFHDRSTFAPADDTVPSPAAEPGPVLPDDAAGEGGDNEPDELNDDEIKNPRLKELSDEAAKWRRKYRKAQERASELENVAADEAVREENRSLRVRLAWERATTNARLRDADAAWALAQDDLQAVEITDGKVDTNRIGEIVNHVIKRYPYLVAEDEPETQVADGFPDTQPSGRRTDGKVRQQGAAVDLAALQRKFPALRGR